MWSHSSSSPGGGLLFGASLFKVSALFPVEVDRGTHQQDLLLFYLAMQSFKIDLRPIWKYWLRLCASSMGFPGGSAGKESACNAGDLGLIPGLGRSLGEGKGYPLQYSGLENSMDYLVHGVAKSQKRGQRDKIPTLTERLILYRRWQDWEHSWNQWENLLWKPFSFS